MYRNFDVEKFAMQQLPPLLRNRVIYALLKSLLAGLSWLQKKFKSYSDEVTGRIAVNGFTINLEVFLNDIFSLDPGTIYITDYESEKDYLHYYEEIAEDVCIGYESEGDQLLLSSSPPDALSGGFAVMVPAELATDKNLETIRKWVEYYRYAGTTYKISTYE